MAEIELKILGIDPDAVARHLVKLGATPLFDGKVKCVHFEPKNGPTFRSKGCFFRMRRWEGVPGMPSHFEICFKGPKRVVDGCKVREEIETTVEDADRFYDIMMAMGYHVTMNNEKRRRSFQFGSARIDIDQYPRVPCYLEIEGPNRTAIQATVKALGLQKYEQSTESGDELFTRLWPEVDFDHLVF